MGSGTVLVESARLGRNACGYDVNPPAYLLSRVYELCNVPADERCSLLDSAESTIAEHRPWIFNLSLFEEKKAFKKSLLNLSPITVNRIKIILDAFWVLLDNVEKVDDNTFLRKWNYLRNTISKLPFSESLVLLCLVTHVLCLVK
jgi:hypothetical protein